MSNVTKPESRHNHLRTKGEALKLAVSLFGKHAFVQFIKDAPGNDERERWRALTKEQKAEERARKEFTNPLICYRCSVGRIESIAGLMAYRLILGQGDTWAEAFLAAQNNSRKWGSR